MKKITSFLLFTVLISFTLMSQKKYFIDAYGKKIKESKANYYRIVTPNSNGTFGVEDYFKENDQIQMKGTFSGKKLKPEERTGEFIYYYKNGQKSAQGEFKNGENEGPWKRWYKNGNQSSEGEYIKGKETGAWKYYYKNGNTKVECNYDDGDRDGKRKYYNEDGSLNEEYNYTKGKIDGNFIEYHKDNKIKGTGSYVKDSMSGKWEEFWENGNKASEGSYDDNKRVGNWIWYHKNGNKSCEAEYNKKGKFTKGTFYDEAGEKMKKQVEKEDLIEKCDFKGGNGELYSAFNKKVGNKADLDLAKKDKHYFYASIKLTIDEEGNVIKTEWKSPDVDEEDFEDKYGIVKALNNAIEGFPKFTPRKEYNRVVEYEYSILYFVDFTKKEIKTNMFSG